ncbi:50S ribosomal protein L24 [Coprinellus micaceus]|uniref:Large ribosomal subunit protein bL28c n=1 Tax=Coprinellus micaceus TaxID=71717 RepID=A0A4Y7TSE2_COPMI|nr:50S ribosomal protein L24 [Coprinellus micaceus]
MFATLLRLGEFSQPFKRAEFGLFGGKTKQYGNNVPFSKHKTRRTWLPNVQRKRLPSEVLGEKLRVKVTTRALRTIKKYGGVDNYLTKTKAYKLSHEGMKLRLRVKDAAREQQEAFLKSPEGRAELVKQYENKPLWAKLQGSLYAQIKRADKLLDHSLPDPARRARMQAAKALGLTEKYASATQTMEYLQNRS